MKNTPKLLRVFLFIVMTLQLTDVACFGEFLLCNVFNLQNKCYCKTVKPDKDNDTYKSYDTTDSFHCPCCIPSQVSSIIIYHYSSATPYLIVENRIFIEKIPSDIFQPPEIFPQTIC